MSTLTEYSLTWELDSLYPHPESDEFGRVWSDYEKDLRQLADDSECLPPVSVDNQTPSKWATFLARCADVFARTEDLQAFVGCHAAADAGNKEFQRLEGTLAALRPLIEQISVNLEFPFRGVNDDAMKAFLHADERLSELGFFLRECQRNAAFRLPKTEELLVAQLNVDGLRAWSRFYDRLSGELRVEVMEKGEVVKKSPGQVSLDAPERSVRENNFFAAQKAWGSIADSCADALNHISGSRLTKYARLGVQDHLDFPLRLNRMTRKTLETMWSTITERKPMLKRYLDTKAKLLGLERLSWYDVTAPLPSRELGGSARLEYSEACRIVTHTFANFAPEWGEFAKHAMTRRWIEAEDRAGKRQGGFCTGFPTHQQSRIFMTFTHSEDSMSTLAHELGHAYHSYVLRDQPLLLQDYPMNLAETASTFAEAILVTQQLKTATDAQRLSMLDRMLSDAVAFLMNIHARFLFEDRYHQERAEGAVSTARFSELMLEAQQEAYCDALDDAGWYPEFWVSKLHFYIAGWPFYNFPYTVGYLLSLGIYRLGAELDNFPGRVREFLIATGSREAEVAVSEAFGEDLTDPTFWQRSLDVVEDRINQFLELAGV
ncbi:MAG: M3 family oligoendopeptidase [Planctomycetaceae bacterium]